MVSSMESMNSGSGSFWTALWSVPATELQESSVKANPKVSLWAVSCVHKNHIYSSLLSEKRTKHVPKTSFLLLLLKRKGATIKSTNGTTLWEKLMRDPRTAWSGTVPVLDLGGAKSAAPLPVSVWYCVPVLTALTSDHTSRTAKQ